MRTLLRPICWVLIVSLVASVVALEDLPAGCAPVTSVRTDAFGKVCDAPSDTPLRAMHLSILIARQANLSQRALAAAPSWSRSAGFDVLTASSRPVVAGQQGSRQNNDPRGPIPSRWALHGWARVHWQLAWQLSSDVTRFSCRKASRSADDTPCLAALSVSLLANRHHCSLGDE